MDQRRIFTELILPIKNSLFRYGYSFLKDRQKAEDIVQETMLRLWNNREKWQELHSPEGYGLGIVRHLCLDELRKKKLSFQKLETVEPYYSNENSPFDEISRKELVGLLQKAVDLLPTKQQMCFHLRETEGKSYDEIAGILGISMEQVKINIYRARNFVKNHIIKEEAYGIQ